jgi:hypothetical protein
MTSLFDSLSLPGLAPTSRDDTARLPSTAPRWDDEPAERAPDWVRDAVGPQDQGEAQPRARGAYSHLDPDALLEGLNPQQRAAVVHDWLTVPGGSEKVVLRLLEMLPGADVFTYAAAHSALGAAFDDAMSAGAMLHAAL